MAEGVLLDVVGGIIERLGSLPFQEIGLIWGVQDEFQKLKERVALFQAILLDSEQEQANNNEVKLWLQSVEDAIYEADDVLDEFNTKNQQRQMMPGNTKLSKKVRLFFSSPNQLVFGLKMGHKLKDVNKRFNEVAFCRPFHLEYGREDIRFIKRERATHSFVPKENIIGRDEDTKAIIQLLLDPISTENVSTISIVGFGGLGKTALAQLIFNDELIQNHFELKIWTCVSNVFELDIVVKKILQFDHHGIEQSQNDLIEHHGINHLQNALRKKVDGKKYLLVLDDVWNDDPEKWLSLKYLLMGGGKGSRILITTRSETVATISDTVTPYTLRGLNEDQSWSLFKNMAFALEDGKEPENSTIKAIGIEVARKCQGVPLAIRTIGGILQTKHHELEWLNFKEKKLSKISQKENDILPTLKLSYDVLPPHLKHCFAYCSLFPPDYEISVKKLIRFWVAQGFIKSSNENEGLEDVAYEYYRELLRRSFFQEVKTDELGITRNCKMNYLMNELAILVSGVGSAVVDMDEKNFHEELRHVSFNFDIELSKWEVPTSLLKANKIRTFLFLRQQGWRGHQSSSRKAFYTTIVSNFKSLRMLSLNALGITTLPNCLRKMKHLRYLDVSLNPMKRLPDWIVGLSNLETLDLTDCWELVELPRDINKMINLRHLNLQNCDQLTGMPHGIGERRRLKELGRMLEITELGKELKITNLRHEKDVMFEPNLKKKEDIQSLTLKWIEGEDLKGVDKKDIIRSMEVLQPHSNLSELSVFYYGGVRFPNWFSSLTNIVKLKLFLCERCQHLPPLHHLPYLKYLHLLCLEKLEYISDNARDDEVEMMRMSFFPSLEELRLEGCPVLKGWWRAHSHNSASSSSSTENLSPSFPFLSTLKIWGCPNLTSMPLYPNVHKLDLWIVSSKVLPWLFVRGASDITHDVGVDVSASSSSPHLSKLTHLILGETEDLKFILSEGMGTSLQELVIHHCPNLAALREGIVNLTSLQSLRIEDCPNLAALPEVIANLTSLQSLRIEACPNLAALPEGIANLTSLQSLSVENFPNWAALPEGIANLTSLQSLRIEDCPNLASLPEEISNLTSLQQLEISNCSNLASLPEGISGLCLKTLKISGCPMLSERCKKEIREDWPKIAHIPSIEIDKS